MGGAGGTGYVTTSNPSSAADGGGIVIIFANEIVGNGYSIIANGFSPTPVNVSGNPDGGGGGGAGGTVVLKSPKFTGNLTIDAKGGDGQDLGTNTQHGPGGGGGGGALLYSMDSLPANVTFSAAGGIGGQHTNATRNGSQDGLVGGTISLYIPVENPNYAGNADGDAVGVECDLDDDNDGIFDTVENGGLPDPLAFSGGSKIPNYFNPAATGFVDTNADGVDDRYDADKDGILNQFDIDSDNDGCKDVIEAGFADLDANGTLGSAPDEVETTAVDKMGTIKNDGGYTDPSKTNGSANPDYLVSDLGPFTTQPNGQSIQPGSNVTFTTVVSGSNLVYAWKQSSNNGGTWANVVNGGTNPAVSNAATNTLTLTNVPVSYNNYQYKLEVTSSSNACQKLDSNVAVLVVNSPPVAVDDTYPVNEDVTVTLLPLSVRYRC